jgi:DNA polymerase-3 subunit delta'
LGRGETAHAYLFTGPRGVGKYAAACVFAAALLSPDGEPEGGEALRRVREGVHPDLVTLEPEGNSIRISQVLEMQRELNLKPVEAGRKVAVINEAEAMNTEAANTLLKTLEEPPGKAVLILVSSNPERLPDTVLSRCYQVRFRRLSPGEIRDYLVGEGGLGEEEAERLTRLSGGIFSKALSFLDDAERLDRRRESLEMAARLRDAAVHEVLDMARRIVSRADQAMQEWRGRSSETLQGLVGALDAKTLERLKKQDKGRRERESRRLRDQVMLDYLEGFSSWFRDTVIYSLALEEGGAEGELDLENPEYRQALHDASHFLYPEQAVEAVRLCEAAGVMLSRNANPLLLMESTLLRLHDIAGRARRAAGTGSRGRGPMG